MASNKINIVISAEDKASKPLRAVADEMDNGTNSSDRLGYSFGKLGTLAGVAAAATGAAALVAAKFAVSSAADYEQSLNIFQSVSGATAEQMKEVAVRSRELGKDMTLPGISAKDAAMAMVELGKAGLSVNDTMAASKGVLSLAKAGQMETAAAAEVAANALNAFGLQGGEASRVADLLAAAANASSSDVKDLSYSLAMSSANAAAVKVPVEDLTTAIAQMANNGIKGSDAGTSLKTMFMNLIPTTKAARKSFEELNLDFYDAKGNFVGLRDMIKQLEQGTKNLTDEQKALHIEQIFGADSSRAANILLKEGVAGYDEMSKAVGKQGAAAALAAAQNSGFNGALDALRSTVETIAIDVGMEMLPALTNMATALNSKVEPAFEGFKKIAKSALDFLHPALAGLGDAVVNELIPALKSVAKSDIVKYLGGALVVAVYAAISVLEGAVRVVSSITSQFGGMTPVLVALTAGIVAYNLILGTTTLKTQALTVSQLALNTAMKLNPLALVASAAIGIVAAYTQVVLTSDRTTLSTDYLKAAQDRLTATTNAAKDAQDRLSGAYVSQEGAALAVERAQRTYNDAVAQYGPKSLEAREAAHHLKRATDDLASSNAAVRDRTNEAKEAERQKREAAAEVVKAHDAVKESAYRAAGGYAALRDRINEAKEADKKAGHVGASGPKQTNSVFGLKNATGTTYSPGGRTLVGEHGPEYVNMPQGAQVIPAYRSREQDSGRGDLTVHIENMNVNNGDNPRRIIEEIGFALELAS